MVTDAVRMHKSGLSGGASQICHCYCCGMQVTFDAPMLVHTYVCAVSGFKH